MRHPILRRHTSGPIDQVSGYVDACFELKAEAVSAEYDYKARSAPPRSQPYIVAHDTSGRKPHSTRKEELLAHQLFELNAKLESGDWSPITVVDFQTPLSAVKNDGLGSIDLLRVGDGLSVIELKVLRPNRRADTPLNALLEAVGYW